MQEMLHLDLLLALKEDSCTIDSKKYVNINRQHKNSLTSTGVIARLDCNSVANTALPFIGCQNTIKITKFLLS